MSDKPNIIELPIDQSEQARQPERKNLLAQEVYEKIEKHLNESHEQLKRYDNNGQIDFDESRSHRAILIDGGRGTGKSSILVNLSTYLEAKSPYLILKPVDPTLLENGDDLLLNVIVAALMRDKLVRDALQNNERLAEDFYEQLHKLGNALEGIQKQKEQYGLDKLRSFMGNQGLAELTHELLKKTLTLTSKQLIVMPIDDVDTSLQLAFENIEVLRKYLTSPYIVPIISGDLNLYNEVIWREFYGRLTNKAKQAASHVQIQARDLAEEYQRKVLPLPRRIQLPQLSSYFKNQNIILKNEDDLFSLPIFKQWLDALLNERVNGQENSQLIIPLNTVREMTQFINATQTLIPKIKNHLPINTLSDDQKLSTTSLKRLIFMTREIAAHVEEFEKNYSETFYLASPQTSQSKKDRDTAYVKLKSDVKDLSSTLPPQYSKFKLNWYIAIADYFRYQRNGAAIFLVAETNISWINESIKPTNALILEHDLFQPLNHQNKKLENFDTAAEIKTEWTKILEGFAPNIWLERLPNKTLLPYPVPEKGRPIKYGDSSPWVFDRYLQDSAEKTQPDTQSGEAELVRQLMTHWSFYKANKQSNLVLTGRLFEVIITSLIRNLDSTDIIQLLNRPPFYSVTSMANTKTFDLEEDSVTIDEEIETHPPQSDIKNDTFKHAVAELVARTNSWREANNIQPPHSWLIYNTMNKAFNQITQPHWQPKLSELPAARIKAIIGTAIKAYHTIWAAFGSFEKGEVFGFPRIIASVNISDADKDFKMNELYRQNILPFLKLKSNNSFFNFKTNSYTYALESHPLKRLLYSTFEEIQTSSEYQLEEAIFAATNKQKIEFKNESVIKLNSDTLKLLLDEIYNELHHRKITEKFSHIPLIGTYPSNSGRHFLQKCLKRFLALNNTHYSSTQL